MIKEQQIQSSVTGIHYITGQPVRVEISDGMITGINETGQSEDGTKNMFLAPGLIDNQINGYAGVDFSGSDLTAEGVVIAAEAIWKDGVTSFLPTVITGSHERLLKNFRILNEALGSDKKLAGSVPGFHLEGPYISPEEGYRGCHPVQHIRKPSW